MTFAERLKQLREKHKPKIYQKELADSIGVSRQAITMWETGQRIPDTLTLEKLSDYFDVSIDYLLGRTDYSQLPPKSIEPNFSPAFQEKNLGDAIVRIVNICAEFNLPKDTMFEMFDKAIEIYGLPGGKGGIAAHGPNYPGSGALDRKKEGSEN